MRAEVDLQIVPGASHLFPEPGALQDVIDLATAALARYLPGAVGIGKASD